MSTFTERKTSAGLRVLVEEIPTALTAACGFFVATGSRHETPEIGGVSHFLEHMAFKATKKRSALEVSRLLDAMGSRANAYTSWERTCYYAQILPEYLGDAVRLIAEMIDPGFVSDDFETEKKVILEEIEMYNDRPEFLLFENLMKRRFAPHPLAGRILGTPETIANLSLEQMKAYHGNRYSAPHIILAVSGAVKSADVFRIAETLAFAEGAGESDLSAVLPEGRGHEFVSRPQDTMEHYLAAWPGPRNSDLRSRYAANVASVLLGDDEGSRLSWALTHPGIADSVDAGAAAFNDTGLVYAGFSALPENFSVARDTFHSELERFRCEGPEASELERAKTKYASRTMLSAESTMSRMHALGDDALEGLGYRTTEEELEIILSISRDEIMNLSATFENEPVSAAIGPM